MTHSPITEQDIEARLSTIQPVPSARLGQRLQHAPWQSKVVRQPYTGFQRGWAVAAATLLMAVGLMTLTPLGALAQELLTRFFTPASSETITQTYSVQAAPTPMADAPVYQPQALGHAQTLVDFAIAQPTVPSPYAFASADVYGGVVYLSYQIPGDTLGRNLVIKQMRTKDYAAWDVGVNAIIQPVEIGEASGEYVKGWWSSNGTEPRSNGQTQQMDLVWTNSIGMHLLHWQQGDFAYEILYQETGLPMANQPDTSTQPGALTLADLIGIAASLQ